MVEAFEMMNGTYLKNNDLDSVHKDARDSKTKKDATRYSKLSMKRTSKGNEK